MTLTIHTTEDEQRQLSVSVEIAEERVQQAMRQTARKLGRDAHIPGFRKGKAPYQVILRRIGEETLRAETIEDMVQPIFEEAVDQIDIEVYGQPSLDQIEEKPLMFKFTVPLPPKVDLGAYRDMRGEVEEAEITEEAVAEALEELRVRHQVVEPVERPAQANDLVTLSGTGWLVAEDEAEDEEEGAAEETAVAENALDEEEYDEEDIEDEHDDEDILFDEEEIELLLDADNLFPGTPFVENIVGLSPGDSVDFSFTFPQEFEDETLAGRQARFLIDLLEVKNRILPELNDELAQQAGEHESLEELREAIRKNLLEEAESNIKNAVIERLVDGLLAEATMVYPPAAVEQEIDNRIESIKGQITRSGWEWEDYLTMQGLDDVSVREQFRETAVTSLERQLALHQFILDEKLTVNPDEVDSYVEKRIAQFDSQEMQEAMRSYLKSGYGLELIGNDIIMDKLYERAKAVLLGQAPDLASLEIANQDTAEEEE